MTLMEAEPLSKEEFVAKYTSKCFSLGDQYISGIRYGRIRLTANGFRVDRALDIVAKLK